jgi:hypothetical protein
MKLFLVATLFFTLSLASVGQESKQGPAITNKDIVEMVKAEFSVDTVVKRIQTVLSVNFDTSTQALIGLKKEGVDERIIRAMLERSKASENNDSKNTGDDETVRYRVPSIAGSTTQEKEKSKKFSLKKRYFTFDLNGCRNIGDTIKCELRVTNNDKETERELVYPYGTTPTMIDESGIRINSALKTIAGHTGGREMLKEGIPVNVSVTFQGLNNPTGTIKLLSIPFSTTPVASGPVAGVKSDDMFVVEFRDVPVAK